MKSAKHDRQVACVKARAYADTSYVENLRLMREAPNDAQRKVLVGLAPAYQHQLARIHLWVGEPEKVIDQLEPLLATPYYLSPGWLQLDQAVASLKGNPRYDRLVARGTKT